VLRRYIDVRPRWGAFGSKGPDTGSNPGMFALFWSCEALVVKMIHDRQFVIEIKSSLTRLGRVER
jgi:hypothetical protein